MQHIILASVLYPTASFNIFLIDLLGSIKNQTYKNFSIIFFLDGIEETQVNSIVEELKLDQNIFFKKCRANTLTPAQIRNEIIKFAYHLSCDILIFCDFDEKIFPSRIEETLYHFKKDITFTYCNAYLTDENFNSLNGETLFQNKKIPNQVKDINPILKRNFIGMGGLALRLKNLSLDKLNVSSDILVFDWFLATFMLLNNWKGKKITNCLVYYRQHNNNHVGANKIIDKMKLHLGIQVKKSHYKYFSQYDQRFLLLYHEICELEKYTQRNIDKYIKIINTYFNPNTLCWWEDIKTLEEIQQWI